MKKLVVSFANTVRAEGVLIHAEKYLAHTPQAGDPKNKPLETLGEHLALVFKHAEKIAQLHGLEDAVERLIQDTVTQLHFEDPAGASACILELFTGTIAFHDFGKVNEYFQTERMKNEDPMFKSNVPIVFDPKYGHSELGAYIFAVYYIEYISTLGLEETDQVKLSALALLFCNSILLHHSSKLSKPYDRVCRSQFLAKQDKLEKYLKLYQGFPQPDVAKFYFDNLHAVLDEFFDQPAQFSFFALLRLNFSLLTAADYLATWHYKNGKGPETELEWGVFSKEKREALILAARTSKTYNLEAYRLFEEKNDTFRNPQEANRDNLNILRTEMAVRVLQQLEQHPNDHLFYLEAPTGGGKTNLSMLAVAELMRRNPALNKVYYVFPFTTLITQTYRAIKETLLLDDDDIALLHSRMGFQTLADAEKMKLAADGTDKATAEENEDGLYGSQRRDFLQNLFVLYPFTLLTHIRFFDILKSKRKDDIYLMHRLANSIVVLDELQSYPPRQWDKMMYLLYQYGQYFNIRFLLMSATLPRLDKIGAVRQAAPDMPRATDLLPNPQQYFQNTNFKGRVQFRFDLLENRNETTTAAKLAEIVLQKSKERALANEGRVFTIVEFIFKKTATEFKGILEQLPTFFDHILVLSGTILESRRREIIAFLKRNMHAPDMKTLLIATQVVEAGVDIDMDLGFKNISLIDSDEQLAGRVNRNVSKQNCEVFLFDINESKVLYGQDLRYKVVRQIVKKEPDFHREILETKNFARLYERVFVEIDKINRSEIVENFKKDYLGLIQQLDFPEVDKKFKIIDQQTLSVFVPVALPIYIADEKGVQEPFFRDFELHFLKKGGAWNSDEPEILGNQVWMLYRNMMENKLSNFMANKIEQKVMQGILAKFTFSLFDSNKNRLSLRNYCDPETSLENYFYLSNYDDLYSLEAGLDEQKLAAPDDIF